MNINYFWSFNYWYYATGFRKSRD